jgi:wobble nucleotide-excising tRNase
MLEKIVQIKNVARFRDYNATGDVTLRKLTLIHADNGRGKTTLCAIFRSLARGEAPLIMERKTLGATGDATVHLRIGGTSHQFKTSAWNTPYPNILVFDPAFVSDNVYSGESVELGHKRNLYRVIVGAAGVTLARKVEDFTAKISAANTDIHSKGDTLSRFRPEGVTLDGFLQWQTVADIDAQIAAKRLEVAGKETAFAKAAEIRAKGMFTKITLPGLPADFTTTLGATLAGIESGAEAKVRQHMQQHAMGSEGEPWLVQGLQYERDGWCPFCEQSIVGSAIITAYRSHFNQGYQDLKAKVAALFTQLEATIGTAALQPAETAINANAVLVEFWGQFGIVGVPVLEAADIRAKYGAMLAAARVLVARKQSSPLDAIQADATFQTVLAAVDALRPVVDAHNQKVDEANGLVIAQKAAAGTDGGLADRKRELTLLEARKKRFEPAVATACTAYQIAVAAKAQLDADKATARAALDAHCQGLMTEYEKDINEFLDLFNTGFRLTKSKHVYSGGVPCTQYQVEINSTALDLGDAKTPTGTPCFKTALSSGDRSALALAFFLAAVKRDANIANEIVVFDDPFTSLDRFRRTATQQFIQHVFGAAQQVVLLSHDPFFLKLVSDGCPSAATDVKCLQMSKAGESTVIGEWDMAEELRGSYLKDHAALLGFYTSRTGDLRSVARSIRPFLEGFLRSHYPGHFPVTEWLGDFIERIRNADAAHGLSHEKASLDELEVINAYSKKYHHQQNPNADAELIDGDELHGFVKRTLRFVGGA